MKVVVTILTLLFFVASPLVAQIKTNVNWSESQKAKAKQVKEWRKLNKEKIKELKEERKAILAKTERIGKDLGADEYLAPYYEAKKHKDQYGPLVDSLRSFSQKDFKDSTDQAQLKKQLGQPNLAPDELKSAQHRAKNYADQYEGYNDQLKNNQHLKDSLSGTVEMMAKRHVKHPAYSDNLVKNYQDQLDARKGQADKLTDQASQLSEGMSVMEKREQLINRAKQLGTNHFSGQTAKVEAAQQKLSKLKKKYSYVPNSNDLSTAKKANSLEGESLKKRFTLGGTLQIHPGKPVGVDFNPQIGYRIHKKWTAGLGGTYRSSFGSGERFFSGEEHETYGGRVFTDYTFFKSFYAHGEFEKIHTNHPHPDRDELIGKWSNGLLVGIGKSYSFLRMVEGNVTVLYNFLHDRPGPYERPWVIRFGFNWKP